MHLRQVAMPRKRSNRADNTNNNNRLLAAFSLFVYRQISYRNIIFFFFFLCSKFERLPWYDESFVIPSFAGFHRAKLARYYRLLAASFFCLFSLNFLVIYLTLELSIYFLLASITDYNGSLALSWLNA